MLARHRRRMCILFGVLPLLVAGLSRAAPGPAVDALSEPERQALVLGERVERPLRFRTSKGEYVGGVAYQLIHATPQEVLAALVDVDRLPELLPRTRSAQLLESSERSLRVLLTQGAGPFVATYGIELVRVPHTRELRFWLDPRSPRDIRDVWGFFRANPRPDGRTLVTVAVAVDLGPGLMRSLFEDRIQSTLLRSVSRIRDAVEPPRLAGVR